MKQYNSIPYEGTDPKRSDVRQTTRRFRVCKACGEVFYTVKSVRQHQDNSSHTEAGVEHISAEVYE